MKKIIYLLLIFFISCSGTKIEYKQIPSSIYGEDISIVICSPQEAIEIDSTINWSDYKGMTFSQDGNILIWFPEKPDLQTLSHELLHTTYAVMQRAGMSLNDSTEEAYAYLLGYYMKQYELLKK